MFKNLILTRPLNILRIKKKGIKPLSLNNKNIIYKEKRIVLY